LSASGDSAGVPVAGGVPVVDASRTLALRPRGNEVLGLVDGLIVDNVVVLKLDRLFRSVEDALMSAATRAPSAMNTLAPAAVQRSATARPDPPKRLL